MIIAAYAGTDNEEHLSMSYDLKRFENSFIGIPNPFERGDIVRLTTEYKRHGTVATVQQEWQKLLETGKVRGAKWAFSTPVYRSTCFRITEISCTPISALPFGEI